MSISFQQISADNRVPGTFVEIDNTQAVSGLVSNQKRHLILGQRLSSGTVAANIPTLVSSHAQAVTYFGRGSMLADMMETLFLSDPYTEKWVVAVDDNGAGVAASGTITVSGTATETGVISLYLGGVLVSVAVASGDSAATVAGAIEDAITAKADLPVTATVNSAEVTVTYRHKGTVGNSFDMRVNYRGVFGGEATPAGISLAIVQLASGATNPTLTSTLAAIPDEIFDFWLFPWTDSTSLTAIKAALSARWDGMVMLEGHAFTAYKGSVSTVGSFGNTQNSPYLTVFDALYNSPTHPYKIAADAVGQIARSAVNDPARPFTTLPLANVLAPPAEDRRTISERNTLLYDGVATLSVDRVGDVRIERTITTYQTNGAGSPDPSYLELNTMLTLSYIRQTFRSRMTQKFPRYKLVDDDTRVPAGAAAVSPKIIKGEIIALAGQWQERLLIEDMAQFKEDLIVQRNEDDPTRVDVTLPPNLVNQLYMIAAVIQFRI